MFVTLAMIMFVASLSPYVASLIPGKPIPEVVFLVFAGAVLGPNMLGVIDTSGEAVKAISELGLAFLFLNAGYEIDTRDLMSRTGGVAAASWGVSLCIGIVLVNTVLASRFSGQAGLAFAIALTTTAYGTLAPIMRDRGLLSTRVGKVVTIYGAYGELLPVISMSILLSTHTTGRALAVLFLFVMACVLILRFPSVFPRFARRFEAFLRENAWSGSQPLLRIVVFLLLLLVGIATTFQLDVVLGAFVAGFILRAFVGQNDGLESKLQGMGNGLLIPVFFVVSGAGIQLRAAFSDFRLLVGFIGLLFLVRGVVVAASLRNGRDTRTMSWQEVFSASAYCTMALPVIVAVTNVAVGSGAMTSATASVLVTAGAITILLIPVVTSFVRVTAEAHPLEAARELTTGQAPLQEVVERHRRGFRAEEARFQRHRHRHGSEPEYSSADYLAAEGVRHGDGSPVSSQVRQGDAPSVSSQSQEQPRPQEQQPQQQPHEPKDSAGEGPAKEEIENDRR